MTMFHQGMACTCMKSCNMEKKRKLLNQFEPIDTIKLIIWYLFIQTVQNVNQIFFCSLSWVRKNGCL